ncbi:NO-inducible flavohemoprotein [Bordetella genomosp. 5]|uniref:Flavohemoprotein n=1 Tax=Bordetella genomosp. 5 TaxID=1395608 RepID=A0A261TH18_9BORD|nr:NO-inducible flavohemoprotein [Bordetella genomosp. 5]OZI47923.1 nitric oxide dioxygenase [Bordetella genomosp. 5]
MLSETIRAQVKATAPVLQAHGEALTRHFYARMFRGNPELLQVFNQGHQQGGRQQQALAGALAAYAVHIDNPSVLGPVIERVTHKHVSLGIRPEHYAIVGKHLLASIGEVLGEAATDELIAAWAAAYQQLADALIAQEAALYTAAATQPGGWSGWRGFKVVGKVPESSEITSFYLAPADGGEVPDFKPGQYISVRVFVPSLGMMQPRQYSLSDAAGQGRLRISVKRERGVATSPDGMVSTLLHERYNEGDVLDLAPPQGDFVLDESRDTPVVLISGGVGITPMLSMAKTLAARGAGREVRFVHGCRDAACHAMRDEVDALVAGSPTMRKWIHYETVGAADRQGVHYDREGRIDLAALKDEVVLPEADYYLCGPLPFMQAQHASLLALGVPPARIHAEVFGTGGTGL